MLAGEHAPERIRVTDLVVRPDVAGRERGQGQHADEQREREQRAAGRGVEPPVEAGEERAHDGPNRRTRSARPPAPWTLERDARRLAARGGDGGRVALETDDDQAGGGGGPRDARRVPHEPGVGRGEIEVVGLQAVGGRRREQDDRDAGLEHGGDGLVLGDGAGHEVPPEQRPVGDEAAREEDDRQAHGAAGERRARRVGSGRERERRHGEDGDEHERRQDERQRGGPPERDDRGARHREEGDDRDPPQQVVERAPAREAGREVARRLGRRDGERRDHDQRVADLLRGNQRQHDEADEGREDGYGIAQPRADGGRREPRGQREEGRGPREGGGEQARAVVPPRLDVVRLARDPLERLANHQVLDEARAGAQPRRDDPQGGDEGATGSTIPRRARASRVPIETVGRGRRTIASGSSSTTGPFVRRPAPSAGAGEPGVATAARAEDRAVEPRGGDRAERGRAHVGAAAAAERAGEERRREEEAREVAAGRRAAAAAAPTRRSPRPSRRTRARSGAGR